MNWQWDFITVRSIATALAFVVFMCLFVWAWRKKNQALFDDAAQIPFLDESEQIFKK